MSSPEDEQPGAEDGRHEQSQGVDEWTLDATYTTRPTINVRRFRLTGMDGPQAGLSWESETDRCAIGAHPSNDLVLDDKTVSRFHCEIRIDARGPRICDLESRNGTKLDGVSVVEAWLRTGSLVRLGRTVLRFESGTGHNRLPISERTEFGSLVGDSVAMRTSFAMMERAAGTGATILLEGETGTGKEGAAEAIHLASDRRDRPFVVVDCGAIPPNLIESQLFGHEAGAFTGAKRRRIGAFEEASSGTIFLDEIGELPLELQPKLLRVLEQGEVRRLGSNRYSSIDVRIVAATNRDLRAEVNAARFRPDLYFRLAVIRIPLPPLRARPEDLPSLVARLVRDIGADEEAADRLQAPAFLTSLARAAWPGNVRELRNHLERCLLFEEELPVSGMQKQDGGPAVDAGLPYAEARRRALAQFEHDYVEALVRLHDGKVSAAARTAEMDRVYLYRLMRRHGLKK